MNVHHRSLNQLFARLAVSIVLGSGAFGLAAHAQNVQTTTTIYRPNPVDLNDFDHHMVYTWRIDNIDLTGKTIVGATLTFRNISNWDNNPNVLHTHLLDTAKNAGVASFYDDNPNNANVTDLTDDFTSTRYHNGRDARNQRASWLVANGTGDTLLANPSFNTTPRTWTYDFFAKGTETILTQYLLNGSDIAFGFDPDCHYYNDGVKFTLITAPSSGSISVVPEAGTLPFLALGGIGLVATRIRRRRK